MRKYLIFLIAIVVVLMVANIGCNNETTELAWINDAGNTINDIIWAGGDQSWSKAEGYADQAQTESKEVNKLDGSVVASINNGSGFVEGTVTIKETNSSS
ncbi:MAG: hypothetical protein ACUVRK_08765, partial [Spirochaetota bacterium]